MMVASYNNRELIYHPEKYERETMYTAMENSPGDFQVISTFPFY